MFSTGAADAFSLSGASGELLLMLLIAFALGALFGRLLALGARGNGTLLPPSPHPHNQALLPLDGADDLTRVPGIGPKTATALRAGGIDSFALLAQTPIADLEKIVHASGAGATGIRTWPTMAAFLAAQKITGSQ